MDTVSGATKLLKKSFGYPANFYEEGGISSMVFRTLFNINFLFPADRILFFVSSFFDNTVNFSTFFDNRSGWFRLLYRLLKTCRNAAWKSRKICVSVYLETRYRRRYRCLLGRDVTMTAPRLNNGARSSDRSVNLPSAFPPSKPRAYREMGAAR